MIKAVTSTSKRNSSVWGRRFTTVAGPVRPSLNVIGEDEEEEEAREQVNHGCCKRGFVNTLWPMLKMCLTFTVSPVSKFGLCYSYLGCLLVSLSAFTISYQVMVCPHCTTRG